MQNNIKAGARHSAGDQSAIQAAHDQTVKAGAVCNATKAWTAPLTIKSVGGGAVEGFLVRYTDATRPDLGRDFFDRNTDLGVKDGQEIMLLWHHNLDPEKRGPIGRGVVKFTDLGLWFKSWLNRRDQYEMLILKMIEDGKAGYSSGANPAGVVRQQVSSKAFRIARWPIVEGSITPTPADPGNSVSLKALAQPKRPMRLSNPDRFYSLVTEEAGFAFAAQLKRQFDLEDSLKRMELEARLDRLQETDADRRARLLRECDRLDPGRHARPRTIHPGPLAGTSISPFDPNADSGRRSW